MDSREVAAAVLAGAICQQKSIADSAKVAETYFNVLDALAEEGRRREIAKRAKSSG